MNKEIRDKNKNMRDRIKELKTKDNDLRVKAEQKVQQGQTLQQEIAQINTERLKIIGAIEELEKYIA